MPEYTQLDSTGCGAASLAMVFDYWGATINYKEIVDVAESDQGTQLPSEVRAASSARRATPTATSTQAMRYDYADRVGTLGSIRVKVVR